MAMPETVQDKTFFQGASPALLYADSKGRIYDEPKWKAAGRRGMEFFPLEPDDLIPLPPGSELFLMPGRYPVGYGPDGNLRAFEGRIKGDHPMAVAAFLPPGYTQHYIPAYKRRSMAPVLPLYAYTAVAFADGRFVVPALRIDEDIRQEPDGFDCRLVDEGIKKILSSSPDNRLFIHLSRCAKEYFCPAARNLFLGRWEAPLPSSPGCNARCVGCISSQPSGCCPATQSRIDFVPSYKEISEVACTHFDNAPVGIASFGQGCEGEPLLESDTLMAAVLDIRRRTESGTLNLNTNGSIPEEVQVLAGAGLNAIRVSLNSAREDLYEAYYRPADYGFDKVTRTLRTASKCGLYTSINYLVFPGVTDQPEEIEGLSRLIEDTDLKMIQWRNLNIDPELYMGSIPTPPGSLGIPAAMKTIMERFPHIRHGYFNPSLKGKKTRQNDI